MRNQPEFTWDAENGVAVCVLSDGYNSFTGIAYCHEDDKDMMSEKTGCQIAFFRAEIDYYTHIRDNELKPALAALLQLYYSVNKSSQYDKKSYMAKMLYRQIQQKQDDLETVKEMLNHKKEQLKTYLSDKDNFYKRVRRNRGTNE